MEEVATAMTNRSLRSIRTELEFLTDSSVITPQQLAAILSQLPDQTILHAPVITANGAQPLPAVSEPQPPVNQLAATSLNEKSHNYPSPAASPAAFSPPAYAPNPPGPLSPAGPPALATASSLYQYNPTDAGDLALLPNDRVMITEYVNAEWWKGRNERTGQEGIFPRSYVRVEEKAIPAASPPPAGSGYGNMPLEVAQTGSGPVDPNNPHKNSKANEMGKKFGKKMGNAAIFGAGATIGSNIVNGIF